MSAQHPAEKDAHDARCEREYTPNGFVFIDCLCSLRRAQAQAWDEGYCDGRDDERLEVEMARAARNPYRVTSPGEPQ